MNTLAIDTSSETLGLCLGVDQDIFTIQLEIGLQHSALLSPWVARLLHEVTLSPADLDLVVCAIGPGSFTGLRIGLATAKGLSLGARCALVGIPSLDSLAARFAFYCGVVVPVIDARKGRYYTALYRAGRRVSEYQDIDLDALAASLHREARGAESFLITGPEGARTSQLLQEAHQMSTVIADGGYCASDPYSLMKLGIQRFDESGEDGETLAPVYVRKSEAEIKLGAGDKLTFLTPP